MGRYFDDLTEDDGAPLVERVVLSQRFKLGWNPPSPPPPSLVPSRSLFLPRSTHNPK